MSDSTNLQTESQPHGVIYVITNNLNGKQYVGQTIQKLNVRLRQHKRSNKPGIDAAIQEYGWENFSAEILETCQKDMLNDREVFWIAKLNTKTPNGYNLTDGGNSYTFSDEIRKKISESQKGKKLSEETKAKLSARNKALGIKPPPRTGKEPWNKGKKWSEETRKKLSESHMGQPAYWKGKHLPEEVRKRISETNKRKGIKPPSPIGNKNNLGKPCPPEVRKKISETLKARNAKKKLEKNNFIEGSLF